MNKKRFIPSRIQLENEILSRTKQLFRQLIEINQSYIRIFNNYQVFNQSNCDILEQINTLHNQSNLIENQLNNWIHRLMKQEYGQSINMHELLNWQEHSKQIYINLSNIQLNETIIWLNEIEIEIQRIIERINELIQSIINQNHIQIDLNQLNRYQELQKFLIDYQTNQIYRISNGTKLAINELDIALVSD